MAAAFPEFRNKPKDYKFESVIQERNDEVQTGKDYTKLWLQSINLVINHANSLKGQLSKHPVKRDLNKLKAVETLFKKFVKPVIEKIRANERHYAPNQTELKKYLSDSKFKIAIRILKQTLESTNGFNQNSWYNLDDKTKKLIEKMSKVLYGIETKLDKANLESVNEGKGVDKIMKIVDTQSFGKLAGQTVDTLSASLFKQVYDKASQGAKDKINQMNERQLLVFMNKLWMRFGKGLSGQMMS